MAFQIADRVKEVSTSTGTGAITLGGALTGFRAFSSVCANGDTCLYALQQVDSNGNPIGVWETGIGTYASSGNTLTRTTILSSSNAGAAVTLAGTTHVWIDVPATYVGTTRETLAPWYVAPVASSSAFAWKGGAFTMGASCWLAGVSLPWLSTDVSGYSYQAFVALANTSNTTLSAAPTFSDTITGSGQSNAAMEFRFAQPVRLVAGSTYCIAVGTPSGGATYALPVSAPNGVTWPKSSLVTATTSARFAVATPANGSAYDTNSGLPVLIHIALHFQAP